MKQNKKTLVVIKFLFFYFFYFNSYSQDTITIKGLIIDSLTAKPIPYVSIIEKKTSREVVSNEEGKFQISIVLNERDSLSLSSIGYKQMNLLIGLFNKNEIKQIKLSPTIYLINSVVIKPNETPLEIVKKAITNIKNNYCTTPFILEGYYREYTKEDSNYGRLIESKISVYDEGYNTNIKMLQIDASEDFKINALKKSTNNILSTYLGRKLNNLNFSFLSNPIRYYDAPINLKKVENFKFTIDSSTYFENELYYNISFVSKNNNMNGTFLINSNDYSIISLTVNLINNYEGHINNHIMKSMPESYTIHFRKYENKLFVNYIKRNYGNQTLDQQSKIISQLEFFTEFMSTDINCKNVKPFDKKELMDKGKDLFIQYDSFNTSLLEKGNILPPTELEKQIEKDIEKKDKK